MLAIACIWNRNSLPALFAGSPVQLSSVPNTAKDTLALLRIFTKAFVIFLALSSKLPEQPTQNKTSGDCPEAIISAIVGTVKFSSVILISSFYHQMVISFLSGA